MYLFSTKITKKSLFYLKFNRFFEIKPVFSEIHFKTAIFIKT